MIISMKNQDGFTLIELIAVMLILGIIATVVAFKFTNFQNSAEATAIEWSIGELNTREKLTYFNAKLKDEYSDDLVHKNCDYDLGQDYVWSNLNISGGKLIFKEIQLELKRTPSTKIEPAKWSR